MTVHCRIRGFPSPIPRADSMRGHSMRGASDAIGGATSRHKTSLIHSTPLGTQHRTSAMGNRSVQLDLFDRRRTKRNPVARASEHAEQVTLMQWATLHERIWPELRLLHAIPNGGWRHPAVAKGLKAEGVKPGVPDLDLPVPKGPYHGLRIELKARGGKATNEQRQWLHDLTAVGHRAVLCFGWEHARDVILEYLGAVHD